MKLKLKEKENERNKKEQYAIYTERTHKRKHNKVKY